MPQKLVVRESNGNLRKSKLVCILTVFMFTANGAHTLHDWCPVRADSRHQSLSKDARRVEAHFVMINGNVHLPCQVVWKVKLVGGIARG